MASWSITGRSVNILSMSSYKTSIVEEYEIPTAVYPSDNIKKVVNIKNEGTVDTFVRIKVDKQWGIRGEDGILIQDTSLNPDMIIIEYNDKDWVEKDGYWYYKDVLKAGETTKHPLFESYTLSKDAGNEYKGKDANIIVTMDSVQADGGAISSIWGISEKELGVSYVGNVNKSTTTGVTFTKSKKIVFDAKGTDLFANFKNLLPGCSRTQVIKLKNASNSTVKFLLRAESVDKKSLSDEDRNLVELLLSKYATITVKNGNSVIYKGTVDGAPKSQGGYTMSKDISLGSIKSKGTKDLVVTLTMDPEMEKEFQSVQDKVSWVFTVTEDDKSSSGGNGNKGDDNNGNGSNGWSGDGSGNGSENGTGSGSGNGSGSGVTPLKPGTGGSDDSDGNGSGSGSEGSGTGGLSPISKGGNSGSETGSVSAISPKTADNTDITLQIIMLLGSLIVLVVGLKLVNGNEEVEKKR